MRLVLTLLALVMASSAAGAIWAGPGPVELQPDGTWRPVESPAEWDPTPEDEEILASVERSLEGGDYRIARRRAIEWLRANPYSTARDRALMLVAQALDAYGNRVQAFYYLDELMDTYPASPLFHQALEMQYEIGDAFLSGYRRRFLLLPVLSSHDLGVEIMFRIQQRSPGSPLAEQALLRTADYYYGTGQWDLAADAYAAYTRRYPRSPVTPRAQLRQAYAAMGQFRGVRFDPTPVLDARANLVDLAASHPELAEEENLAEKIQEIDRVLARKLYDTADFYRRTNEPRAAAYTYRRLIEAFPQSQQAERARRQLARIDPAGPEEQ